MTTESAADFEALLAAHGLELVAQPAVPAAGGKRGETACDFFVYSRAGTEPLKAVAMYQTNGGTPLVGTDDGGRAIACVKLDRTKLPEDIVQAPPMASAEKYGTQLLHSLSTLKSACFHAPLPGNKHMLLVRVPGHDETSLLKRLETAGLFSRTSGGKSPDIYYPCLGGMLTGIEIPPALWQAIQRTQSNQVPELREAEPALKKVVESGGTKARIMKAASEYLRLPEKEKSSPQRKNGSPHSLQPAKTLQENVDALRKAGLVFARKRKLDGTTQTLLMDVTPATHRLLTEAGDKVTLTPADGQNSTTYVISEDDKTRLAALVGEEHCEDKADAVLGATLPGSFFTKYRVLFAGAANGASSSMYVAPALRRSQETSSAALLQDLTGYGLPSEGERAVSHAITAPGESPPVVRVALTAQVASDLRKQMQGLAHRRDNGNEAGDVIAAEDGQADDVARESFGVKLKAEVQTTHMAAVVPIKWLPPATSRSSASSSDPFAKPPVTPPVSTPYEKAISHLADRTLITARVIHRPVPEPDAAGKEQMRALLEKTRGLTDSTGSAMAALEEAAAAMPHLPEASKAALKGAGAIKTMSQRGADADGYYESFLEEVKRYNDWVAGHAKDEAPIAQLIVVNPNARTKALLNAPQMQAYMTRPPEMHKDFLHGKNVMMIYPDPQSDLIADIQEKREESGEKTPLATLNREPLEAAELSQALRRYFAPRQRETNDYQHPPLSAEECFKANTGILKSLKPLYALEEPDIRPGNQTRASQRIGARPVLILKVDTPLASKARNKLQGIMGAFSPFLEGRESFCNEEAFVAELMPQERDYFELGNKVEELKAQRHALDSMKTWLEAKNVEQYNFYAQHLKDLVGEEQMAAWGLSEFSGLPPSGLGDTLATLSKNIVSKMNDIREELEELETCQPDIAEKVQAYRDGIEEGKTVLPVQREPDRFYTLDGRGFSDIETALKDGGGYIKLYVNQDMNDACRKELKSHGKKCFRNSSSNLSNVPSMRENEMQNQIPAAFSPVRGR